MRSYDETDEYDQKELARLNAEPWMVEQLKLNPEYPHWGPGEDYMHGANTGKDHGWQGGIEVESWDGFDWNLDDLNECVNFHFNVERSQEQCPDCEGCGYNPETRVIEQGFYGPDYRNGWCDKITQDEVDALVKANRLCTYDRDAKTWVPPVPYPTAEEVNACQRGGFLAPGKGQRFHSHDGINRGILVEARATRLGVYGLCPKCEGHGHVFTEPKAKLGITLWMIHPRKGASRGIEVKEIRQEHLPAVYEFLRKAALRNAQRFSKLL